MVKNNYRITGVLKGKYELRDKNSRLSIVNRKQLDKLKKKYRVVADF